MINIMNNPKFSETIDIIVVARDRFSMFPRCLEALYAHTNVPFKVLVVTGGTDGVTEKYLRQSEASNGNFSVIFEDRLLMQGEARNIALRQTNGRFCVVLENDTIVHRNWLPPLLECMRAQRAAVVMPLVLWYQRIHAAGCMFEEREKAGARIFNHKILYTEIQRRPIDYPECHCILIDRKLLPNTDIFEDVEPFDVDLGLTLRKHGFNAFLEPHSVVTYSALPALEVRDVPLFKFRWDPASWELRNRLFMQKWSVIYEPSSKKLTSYRRQQFRLGFARWYPNKFTVGLSNVGVSLEKRFISFLARTST
jgi:glycosyltransferase involved in cell wall biosynthesis